MGAEIECAKEPLPRTEAEFDQWLSSEAQAEFVDGRVIQLPPVPLTHYRPHCFLICLIDLLLEAKPAGELFGSRVMVRLRPGLWRVPDLFYVAPAHHDRIRETRFEGAPDAVWEIISPDSEQRDWREKVPEYQDAGIREYWIVNPYVKTVWLLRLNAEGKYENIEAEDGKLASSVIPGFWLRPDWLWADPRPRIWDCLRELGALPEA